ncbi:hypothetical protein [Polaribacter sp. Asnod6-C07]|uniref:hypothetical protein n=1 Tax=Polaribacter sp. Asnod6-C07 TaxID=3160582 RepID=UPI00386CB851
MKTLLASLLFWCTFLLQAQGNSAVDSVYFQGDSILQVTLDSTAFQKDSIIYLKNTQISTERDFNTDLKEKYKGDDFEYKEEEETKKEEPESETDSNSNSAFLGLFSFFMSSIFPFLLGGFVIFVILKSVLGFDARFWKPTNKAKTSSGKLIYEDEDIHELNLEALLQQAITNKDFRLAIRYYYLSTLKSLSNNKIIDYHKDKTNSEYLFEIENTQTRTEFSYLSYVYSYVWYGEFPVDENSFQIAQNKYQSFLKSIV